ncbi:hypothetical protein COMA2_110002 [Candidatus Nitrospira nitrificans]|uniref:Uncharacterized protein n=1 Tax=Candidatus Nitrospira nitrificans TaxID=1742973 RepID=A0A0S4LA12_9BACT|nr:hypothetical protein COMA2_110002 [Candidatus Nitrospira nitrificans]
MVLAETCPRCTKVSAAKRPWPMRQRTLVTRSSSASRRCTLRRRGKAPKLATEERVSDDAVCTRSARAMAKRASDNHISIPPDRFPHLHGQAEIHMYICHMWKQLEKCFLLSFEYLGILATNFLNVYVFGYQCRWAVVS